MRLFLSALFAAFAVFVVLGAAVKKRSVDQDDIATFGAHGVADSAAQLAAAGSAPLRRPVRAKAAAQHSASFRGAVGGPALAVAEAAPAFAAEDAAGGGGASGNVDVGGGSTSRMIIKNVQLSLALNVSATAPEAERSKMLQESIAKVKQLVETTSADAFVARSNLNLPYSANIECRVPVEQLDRFIGAASAYGRVTRQSMNADDVTEQFHDVQIQLSALRAAHKKLLELNERAQAVKDVLEVQREATRVGSDIDRLEGRARFLSQRATLSSVTIDFSFASAAPPPPPPPPARPIRVFWDAVGALLELFALAMDGAIVFVVVGIPLLLVAAACFVVARRGYGKLKNEKQ